MAHAFTRVTLIGSRRHLDLLLPSDQPVGALMPQVLELLNDPPADEVAAKVLVGPDGTELSAESTLSSAAIADGSSLLLCNASEAPPAAVVYDVTDLVVSETEAVSGRWTDRFRELTAGIFAAVGLWAGAEILLGAVAPDDAWWLLLSASLVLLTAGTALARPPRTSAIGPTLQGAGWLLGLGALLRGDLEPETTLLLFAGLSVLTLVGMGLSAANPRALFTGAGTLALATVIWAAAGIISENPSRTAALAAVASVLLLGLLPKLALSASGLATLDDQRATGGTISRTDALEAVAGAHRGLTLGAILTSVSIALGLWVLGTDAEHQKWTLPLLFALTLAVFLRARSFPLAAERISLYAASGVGLTALTLASLRFFSSAPWAVGLAVLILAACIAVSLTLDLPDHAEARLRLLAKRLETFAILASIPLVIGMFGIYSQLLDSF
ncbi:type VII secretion integral membrane protein EccD [Arthrobacter sp. zg-Y1110]|uniref:type VII secretion integral membrane protein EccD n=1 Tax=Arthrobacter sp. zg-Y1110 TaxID=2886932 RepID=UPI001D154EE3|nr:type VII secretion integral membrane protein EccD [Arthrobacter sp. zg-Y1110]MCC3292105.1 type VII secretion integral membrane protein EccD [Arthrobacter sp. zg-Y1110]UWX85909.1 type VII secretion integral membrane protein EccD [Arthrobacter sp. zg-Y1110]